MLNATGLRQPGQRPPGIVLRTYNEAGNFRTNLTTLTMSENTIETQTPETNAAPKKAKTKRKVVGFAAKYIGKGKHIHDAGVFKTKAEAEKELKRRGVAISNQKIVKVF